MDDIFGSSREEEFPPPSVRRENALLDQVARLLVREELITPEEQLRFLAFLKEER